MANRQNSQRSTGPKTAEGKARSSQNAFKHGLRSKRDDLIAFEAPDEYAEFRAKMLKAIDPEDILQESLADRVVANCWRLRRVLDVEAAYVARYRDTHNGLQDLFTWTTPKQAMLGITDYERRIESSLYRAMQALAILKSHPKLGE